MITKELLDYITYQLDHGESWEGTRGDLSSSGWAINVLDEAYLQVMTKKKEAAMAQLPNPLVEVASESGNTSVSPEQVKNSNPEKTLIKSPLTPTESGISVPGVRKQEQPKGKGKLIGLISIIVVVLVLIGGSAFAYFNYIYSDNVLARIFVNSQNLESGEFSGKIKFEYTPSEKTKEEILAEIPIEVNKMKGEFDLSGRYNFKNKENVKMDVIVKANSKSENDASYGIDSEWKIIDNAIYGKVNNLVAPQELDQYVASAKLIALSRWIKLYASGQDEESISVKLINARKEIQKNSNEINKNLIKAVSLQFQGFENNDNILCSKFKVVFDKQKTRELFIVLAKEKNLSEDEINETLVAYDKVYEDLIKNINANISVGVFDSLIHNASIVFTGPLEGGMSTIDINVSSKKENSDIKVDDIADFTEIEKIFEDMSSAIVAISQEIDDSIKSAMQQAKDIAESYKALKGTYINFDTSIDGEKIIKENINSWGGNAVTIFTTKEKYCLSKDLINALGT
ncbi:hypothetical protein M0Q03_01215, partial [bacterium]|nr:hypothetical protein [bacterium]